MRMLGYIPGREARVILSGILDNRISSSFHCANKVSRFHATVCMEIGSIINIGSV